MSATIVDLSAYGDVKGRDSYLRNSFHSVKGDGVSASAITEAFYGVASATTDQYELARLTVSEGAVDNEIGSMVFGISNGTTLNDVLLLNNTASTLASTTINLESTDIFATGTMNVGTIQMADLAEGARVELVSDATDPAINFVLGDLSATPSTPLVLTEAEVAITGILTIGGVDVLDLVDTSNPWEKTGTVTQLKSAYNSVEINVVNAYSTSVALDVNGSIRIRGNDVFFYDEPNDTHYSTLAFIEGSQEVRLRASRAGDSVVIATSNGTDNTYLDRLTFSDGLGTQEATFTNVNVGIGAAPSGTYALEVTGNAFVSTGLVSSGDVDLLGNNLVNVTNIDSSDALAERARITLTSSATAPQVDVILGDLDATPTTVATFTEVDATITVPVTMSDNLTIQGDLTVQGTTVTFNTSEVTVEDINIALANSATLHAEIDGGGITLGEGVTGITTPSLTYSQTKTQWVSSVGIDVESTADITVGTSTLKSNELSMESSDAVIYLGANKEWRIAVETDGSGDDHITFSHDDETNGVYVTKLDVMQ